MERAITVNFDRDLRWIISSVTPMLSSSIKVKFDTDFLGFALDQTTTKASHWYLGKSSPRINRFQVNPPLRPSRTTSE